MCSGFVFCRMRRGLDSQNSVLLENTYQYTETTTDNDVTSKVVALMYVVPSKAENTYLMVNHMGPHKV